MPAPIIIVSAGTSPAGLGAPVEFVSPAKPPAILGDDIDQATGEYRSILRGIHPVDSHVITRLRTKRGSGVSVAAVGHEFHLIRKVDDSFVRRAQDALENMFADLIDRRDIELPKTAVIEDGDTGHIYFQYRNLRADSELRKVKLGTAER
jgi:hypothetical protein